MGCWRGWGWWGCRYQILWEATSACCCPGAAPWPPSRQWTHRQWTGKSRKPNMSFVFFVGGKWLHLFSTFIQSALHFFISFKHTGGSKLPCKVLPSPPLTPILVSTGEGRQMDSEGIPPVFLCHESLLSSFPFLRQHLCKHWQSLPFFSPPLLQMHLRGR